MRDPREKHLTIFPVPAPGYGPGLGVLYGVTVCNFDDPDRTTVKAVYFDTKTEAEAFVVRAREFDALLDAHQLPRERITIGELQRRADE